MGDTNLAVEKKDTHWQITAPKAEKADDADLDQFVQRLSSLRAAPPWRPSSPRNSRPSASTIPRPVWTLKTGGDDKKPVILKIGKLAAKEKEGEPADPEGDRFVQVEGGQTVGVLPGALRGCWSGPCCASAIARWPSSPMPTRCCSSAARARSLSPRSMAPGSSPPPCRPKPIRPTSRTSSTRFPRFAPTSLSPKRADLAKYGLDKPDLRWTFKLAGKDVLDLIIGNLEKNGLRRYAKLANNDIVFLLSLPATTQATREYRNRTVWPTFDAAQVNAVQFNFEGAKPFTLEKVGDFWAVGDKQVKGPRAAKRSTPSCV